MSGPRRAGKTSVCGAACAVLRDEHDFLVIELEAPEQSTAEGVCQLIIDRAARLDLQRISRGLLKAAIPTIQVSAGRTRCPAGPVAIRSRYPGHGSPRRARAPFDGSPSAAAQDRAVPR
jgi:hypothetical protein